MFDVLIIMLEFYIVFVCMGGVLVVEYDILQFFNVFIVEFDIMILVGIRLKKKNSLKGLFFFNIIRQMVNIRIVFDQLLWVFFI